MKKIGLLAAAAIVIVGTFGAGLLAAVLFRGSSHPAMTFVNRVANKIERNVDLTITPSVGPQPVEFFPSTFLGLEGQVVQLPRAERRGYGGAVTAIGDEALVLRFDGQVFAVRPDGTIARPDIDMPENGFRDYLRTIRLPEYEDYHNRPDKFRFNDILYHDGPLGPRLLVSYLFWDADAACWATKVSQLTLETAPQGPADVSATAEDWKLLYRMEPCLPLRDVKVSLQGEEAGGRMAVTHDGRTLYLSNGDYGWNGYHEASTHPLGSKPLAQYPGADHGKVIEIDLETGASRHFSSGHRNPQGIAIDAAGRIWSVEHGPRGGDELNLIKRGRNYGWPLATYGTDYNGAPIPVAQSLGRHTQFTMPAWAFLPSVATSGLLSIDGFHPAWDGDLLATTIRGKKLIRFRLVGERVIFAERIEMRRKLRDVIQMSEDTIVVWTDDQEVIFLRALDGGHGDQFVELQIEQKPVPNGTKDELRRALDMCSECHSFNRNQHGIGPTLAHTAGRPVARSSFENYSETLLSASETWTHDRLVAYLDDPDAVYPGTTMPDPEIDDPEILNAIADILESLARSEQYN